MLCKGCETPSDNHAAACIARFRELAKAGAHGAASSGERTANKLAKTLNSLGDDMALLDADAILGFYHLCMLAHGPWATDEGKSHVFQIIAQAAR